MLPYLFTCILQHILLPLAFYVFCCFKFGVIQLQKMCHIELNPGPQFQNQFFNFMSWNLNSLAKEEFERVKLIEAHNSIFDYDLISINETSLNDSVQIPDPLINDYTFESANNPANTRHGGVGLFYKNSLPIVIRKDLSFEESIVAEIKYGRKKIFLLFYIEALLAITLHLNFNHFW